MLNRVEMHLLEVPEGQPHSIVKIDTDDVEMDAFLFRLGCYEGEEITVLSKSKRMCTVVIKDGRYSIDPALAKAIIVLAKEIII